MNFYRISTFLLPPLLVIVIKTATSQLLSMMLNQNSKWASRSEPPSTSLFHRFSWWRLKGHLLEHLEGSVGNELVHAGSHARPQAMDRGMPSQGYSTEWWYLYLIKCPEPTVGYPPVTNRLCYAYSDCKTPTHNMQR